MAKMTIMKGLPASGKSTKAKELLTVGNTVRINKDLIRTMLHFDVFDPRKEGLTQDAAKILAGWFLNKGVNVIIDDTNLNPKVVQGLKEIAKNYNAKIEYCDMTNVSAEECVMRDLNREKHVGGTVIKNMAIRYGLVQYKPKSVVLCDIDGTIANLDHRLHYVKGETKDWKSFFAEIHNDTVRQDVARQLVDLYNQGKTIIFMSARPDNYKEETLKWLSDNYLSFAYTLIMRNASDKRPDTEVKRDMMESFFPDREVIHTIFDDRPSIIRLWQEMGLNVVDVGKGIEF